MTDPLETLPAQPLKEDGEPRVGWEQGWILQLVFITSTGQDDTSFIQTVLTLTCNKPFNQVFTM